MLLADREYDADWIRAFVTERGGMGQRSAQINRREPVCVSPYLYRARNLVERFFNKIKQCRRVATRYDKLTTSFYPARVNKTVAAKFMSSRPKQKARHSVWGQSAGASRVAMLAMWTDRRAV